MDVPAGYVDLGRQFDPYDPGQDPEQAALRSYLAQNGGAGPGAIGWTDLLDHGRAVILAEARSGKTWEMLAQVGRLRSGGKAAFFARIELLASGGLDKALGGAEDQARLKRWLAGTETGYFFLDAVDEARLHSHADFEGALSRLSSTLGQALSRASVVITSRVSAWRGEADLQLVQSGLGLFRPGTGAPPAAPKTDAQAPAVRVVTLAALGRSQVEQLAFVQLAGAAEPFIRALDQRDAWAFAGRPQDVIDLLRYWQEKAELGSLTDLVEFDIQAKLAETNPSYEGKVRLDPVRAREGAERLAGAATLARRFTIRLSGGGSDDGGDGLDPITLLPDWPAADVRALLGRAIFDEAAYGAVRFHHRRTQEYLAARWLHRLLAAGLPRSELRRLLFRERYGHRVVPPSLGPVVAWLAGWDPQTRRTLLEVDPDLLLRHGDPERLELEDRKRLLRRIAQVYEVRRGIEDMGQLRRLAHPDLADTVDGLLRDPAVTDEIRCMLLLLVRHGGLGGCGEAALSIAGDPCCDQTLRSYAVWALGELGEPGLLGRLAAAVLACPPPPKRLADDLVTALYPETINEEELQRLLTDVEAHSSRGEELAHSLSEKIPSVPDGRLPALLRTLMTLARQEPHLVDGDTGNGLGLCSYHLWTAGPMVEVLRRLVPLPGRAGGTVGTLADAAELLGKLLDIGTSWRGEIKGVPELFAEAQDVRREVFWRRFRSARTDEHPDILLHGESYESVVRYSRHDTGWLLRDAATASDIDEAKTALAAALWLSIGQRLTREERSLLRGLCSTDELRQVHQRYRPTELKRLYHRSRYRLQNLGWKLRRLRYLRRKWPPPAVQKLKLWMEIIRHLPVPPERVPWYVIYNAVFAFYDNDLRSHDDGDATLDHVRQRYAAPIERRVAAWLKAFWRRWPLLPEGCNIDYRWANLALYAVSVEVRGGLDWGSVTPQEAAAAVQIAPYRLNRFPGWLADLHACHPLIVEEALGRWVNADFAIPADCPHAFGEVTKLAWDPRGVGSSRALIVARRLSNGDPIHVDILRHTLTCLLNATRTEDIARLAPDRCHAAWDAGDRKRFLIWMGTWLQVATEPALDRLNAHLDRNSAVAQEVIQQLAAGLSHRHGGFPRSANPDFTRPEILRRLIPLVYHFVHPAQDNVHDGVYQPDQRDNAEDFRNELVSTLTRTPGENAHRVMLDLAADPAIPFDDWTRRWLRDAARVRAAEDAEDQPWTAGQVDAFDRRFTRMPETADALFDVILARLDDIRDDAENGDFSPRGDFDSTDREEIIQRWIGGKLEDTSRGAYEGFRESEVHGRKRPDIKLQRTGLSPTTLEIKWAHKEERSYTNLLAALRDQLVGDYMRSNRSNHGVLVLVNLDSARKWHPPSGPALDFPQLVQALDREAAELARDRGRGERIRVVGMDLSPVPARRSAPRRT